MRLGIDVSTYDELLSLSPKYYYRGQEIEPLSFLRDHNGVSLFRVRLWVDPHDEDGNPYGGGTNDLPCLIRLCKKAREVGFEILLDFHYGDFWVDPAKQHAPKAWMDLSFEEAVEALGKHTRETLLALRKEGIPLYAVQVGNEITRGMCWPFGQLYPEAGYPARRGGFDGLADLLKEGIAGVREVYPESKIVLHLEHSCSYDLQSHWLKEITSRGVEFDVLGQSYYSYWHGSLPDFVSTNKRLREEFHKPIWVVEVGYAYAYSPYADKEHGLMNLIDEKFVLSMPKDNVPFPLTKEGQADFLKAFLKACKDVGVEEVYYWEPLWYPVESSWGKEAGRVYSGDLSKPLLNEWCNEALFDFEGNANPAVDVYSLDFVDNL